ncbi:hypothetical protein [Alkalihalobacillus sp. 1P02AB]|uniref:hypothetical protein n=1 Tax=Alkalihalobacillus sp. 1P02AB TaxID=3132260 RepID=UPI0039A47706
MRKIKCILAKEEIVKRYLEGESTLEISNIANVSQRRIRTILNEMNVQFRPRGS